MQIVHGFKGDNIRGDIYGGLTAAVVALPLALAFGVAFRRGPDRRGGGRDRDGEPLFVKRMADLQDNSIRAITGDTEDAPLSDEARQILKAANGRLQLFHLEEPMSFGIAKGMGKHFSVADKFEGWCSI